MSTYLKQKQLLCKGPVFKQILLNRTQDCDSPEPYLRESPYLVRSFVKTQQASSLQRPTFLIEKDQALSPQKILSMSPSQKILESRMLEDQAKQRTQTSWAARYRHKLSDSILRKQSMIKRRVKGRAYSNMPSKTMYEDINLDTPL